ncbi:MAG: right-handed parallel beta-helix repeat-containing protein [Cyclobacteriaceae bacterium]
MMSKNRNLIAVLIMVVGIVLFGFLDKSDKEETVSFDLSIAEDATPSVLRRIMKTKEQPIKEIKFEKGVYHFYPDKGLEFFVYISNHNDVLIKTAFPLIDIQDLTIDGQGSKFIFHGRMIPFLIDNSSNIKVKNLSVDWHEPFHSEGLVVGRDLKNETFDLKISEAYPYEIRNNELVFIKEYYEHGLGQAILYDPERGGIAFDTESYTPLTLTTRSQVQYNVDKINYKYKMDHREPRYSNIGREYSLRAEQLKPGLVRIYNHRKKIPEIGKVLVCKGHQTENRLAPAFRVTHTAGFIAENVNVHHAGGMGLIAENSSDILLDSFNVIPSNGRMVSTTADATHFVGCRGKVELRNCVFNNQLDDASNVHGTYQEIVDILSENSIGVRMGHFQQQGFMIGNEGDEIGLVRLSNSFFPFGKQTIKSIEKINSRYQIVTFNEKLAGDIQPGDLIENLDAYPEFIVRNCTISQNRARGLLLSSPKKTIIENNYFSTEMEALLIPVESGHWFESGSATDLIVRNNVFQDCTHSGQNRGVIRFVTDDDNENIAFKNILIENNEFNHFDNLILEIANTEGLEFKNNTITISNTFPQLFPENPAVRIKSSKNLDFAKNNYSGNAKTRIESDLSNSKLKL